jgi:hypothetical protein
VSENDQNELRELSGRIPELENAGTSPESRTFFSALLTDSFAFRRRTGVVVGRQGFLDSLVSGGDRTVLDEPRIELIGEVRATVRYTVAMTVEGRLLRFDNLQLFVKDQAGKWRLLAWANEETV